MPYVYPPTPYHNAYAPPKPTGFQPAAANSREQPKIRGPPATGYWPGSSEAPRQPPTPFIPPMPGYMNEPPIMPPSNEARRKKSKNHAKGANGYAGTAYSGYPHQQPVANGGEMKPLGAMFGGQVNQQDYHGGANHWPAPPPTYDSAAAKLAPLKEMVAQLEAENQRLMNEQRFDEERRLQHRLQELQAGNWYLKQRRAYGY